MRFVGPLLKAVTAMLALIVAALVAVPMLLPDSICRIEKAAYDALEMTTSYSSIAGALGCDGRLVERRMLGEIRHETFAWRGLVWPFGEARLEFYDGTLQKKTLIWLDLRLGRTRQE